MLDDSLTTPRTTGTSIHVNVIRTPSSLDCQPQPPHKRQGQGCRKRRYLYGREHCCDLLQRLYCTCSDDAAARSNVDPHCSSTDDKASTVFPRLVLLEGPRGVGKRSLAQSLRPVVAVKHGLFLFGICCYTSSTVASREKNEAKEIHFLHPARSVFLDVVRNLFDALNEAQVLQALRDDVLPAHFAASDWERLCEILSQIEPRLASSLVHDATGYNDEIGKTLLLSAKPETSLTGRTVPFVQTVSSIAQPASSILARFVRAVSTLMPVVLSIHQAEYATNDELDAMQSVLNDSAALGSSSKGLLIVLSYDSDVELHVSAPMRAFLAQVAPSTEDSMSSRVREIVVSNLNWEDTHDWIKDWCSSNESLDDERIRSLTDYVHRETLGNPQHINFLLLWLKLQEQRDNLQPNQTCWLDPANDKSLTSTVGSLFRRINEMQDSLVQSVVETVAALLEHSTYPSLTVLVLEMVLQQPCSQALDVAVEYGLLECHAHGQYQFHDNVLQKVAYDLIPEPNRAHLRIGRRLWRHSSLKDCLDDRDLLSTVAQQLHCGIDLVTDATERGMIVEINYEAGKAAMKTGAFSLAAAYFERSILTLQEQVWAVDMYEKSLALHNAAAEAYYSSGDFAGMDSMLDAVFDNSKTLHDKLQAYTTLVFANGSRNRFREAVATAIEVLDWLGEPLPSNPSRIDVWREYVQLRCLLRGKNSRFFSNLPTATDANKIAAMTLLNFTVMYAYPFNPACSDLATFALIRLAIQHGITSAASFAICSYGVNLATMRGRFAEGFRYGQIAVDLLDRVDSRAWVARVSFMVFGAINPWMRPFRESLEPLRLAQQSAQRTGDIEGSAICAWFQQMTAFHMGGSLAHIEDESSRLYDLMEKNGQTSSLTFLRGLRNLARSLHGDSCVGGHTPLGLAIESAFDSSEHDQGLAFHAICRMIVYSHVGEYRMAITAAQQSRDARNDIDFLLDFYEGLSCFCLARDTAGWASRRVLVSKGWRCLKRLTQYASLCPANFRNKRDLLKAELESLRGRHLKSFTLFEDSIAAAENEGFLQEEGLAYERLARYHCFLNHPVTALPYFACARDAYARWDAQTLVHRAEELIKNVQMVMKYQQ